MIASCDLPLDYDAKKENILKSLQKSHEEINDIERLTVGQISNQRWVEERQYRLTASNFGKICKMRPTTSCASTVKNILYRPFIGVAATDWGQTHEATAIKEFEEKTKKKVEPAGLIIDAEHVFLAASPDGFIGHDSILEVKCPYSAKEMTPKDAILANKIKYCQIIDDVIHLKETSACYYQVQGQLHISRRDYCYFVVWTLLGFEFEKIRRNDKFWETKMEHSLVNFYQNCILPEIVDGQYPKELPIRDLRRKVEKV